MLLAQTKTDNCKDTLLKYSHHIGTLSNQEYFKVQEKIILLVLMFSPHQDVHLHQHV